MRSSAIDMEFENRMGLEMQTIQLRAALSSQLRFQRRSNSLGRSGTCQCICSGQEHGVVQCMPLHSTTRHMNLEILVLKEFNFLARSDHFKSK
jgi:hypothetical protein